MTRIKYIGSCSGGSLYDRREKKRVPYVRGYPIEVSDELADELLEDQQTATPEWVEVRKN